MDKFTWNETDLKPFPLTLGELRKVKVSRKPLKDAEPKRLYVRRNVLNSEDIRAHYKSQGMGDMLPADQMHVTILYTINAVDWMKAESESWTENDDGGMTVKPGGARMHDLFGPGNEMRAFVLMFNSSALAYRHMRLIETLNAQVSYPDYQPHITLSYRPDGDLDPESFEPYRGEIALGPEIFEDINEDFKASFSEDVKPKAKAKRARKSK